MQFTEPGDSYDEAALGDQQRLAGEIEMADDLAKSLADALKERDEAKRNLETMTAAAKRMALGFKLMSVKNIELAKMLREMLNVMLPLAEVAIDSGELSQQEKDHFSAKIMELRTEMEKVMGDIVEQAEKLGVDIQEPI